MPLTNRFFRIAQQFSSSSLRNRSQTIALTHPKFGPLHGPFLINISSTPVVGQETKPTLETLVRKIKNSDETAGSFIANYLDLSKVGPVLQHTLQYIDGGMRHLQGLFFYSNNSPEITSDQTPDTLDVSWKSEADAQLIPACGVQYGQLILGDNDLLHDFLDRIATAIDEIEDPKEEKLYHDYWQAILSKIQMLEDAQSVITHQPPPSQDRS